MIVRWISLSWRVCNGMLSHLAPGVSLLLRWYIWDVFFYSGLNKWQTWDTTLYLFTYEYEIPLLSSTWAAYLGTGAELLLPVLLLLGVGGRFPALALFIFNFVAAWSYPFLWTEAGAMGLEHHIYWGLLLLVLMTYGTGILSVDWLLNGWKNRHSSSSKCYKIT